MDTDLVESVGTEEATTPSADAGSVAPPSAPAATSPALSLEVQAEIDRRVQAESRRFQSISDRQVAAARQEALQRERAVREAAKAQLARAGVEHPEQIDEYLDAQSKIAYADQVLRQKQDEEQARAQAQDFLEAAGLDEYGVTVDDPRLYNLGTWENYKAKLKELRREEERKARATETETARLARAQQVDQRVNSGALASLTPAPATSGNKPQQLDSLYGQLAELQARGAPRNERDAIKDQLRALGEENV